LIARNPTRDDVADIDAGLHVTHNAKDYALIAAHQFRALIGANQAG
jgi:hypothetical protein